LLYNLSDTALIIQKASKIVINCFKLHSDTSALSGRFKSGPTAGILHQVPLLPSKTYKHFKVFVSSHVSAIFQKAESLYHLGDFEHSLMYYHRGLRLRPELEGFRLGVQKAQEAIENTIGSK
jgi:hypothetical protein